MNKRKIPTGDEWWYQEPYRTHGPLSDWFDIEAILAEQRRRIVGGIEMLKNGKNSGQVDAKLLEQRERIAETVKRMQKERFWCGEDPETEEVREMDRDEPCAWGSDMSFAYNAALDGIIDKLTKKI